MRKRELWLAVTAMCCLQITSAPMTAYAETEEQEQTEERQTQIYSEQSELGGADETEQPEEPKPEQKPDEREEPDPELPPDEPEEPKPEQKPDEWEEPDPELPPDKPDEPDLELPPDEPEEPESEQVIETVPDIAVPPEKAQTTEKHIRQDEEPIAKEYMQPEEGWQPEQAEHTETNVLEPEEVIPEIDPPEVILKTPKIRFLNLGPATASRMTLSPEIMITDMALTQGKVQVMLTDENGRMLAAGTDLTQEGSGLVCRMNTISRDGRYTLLVRGENEYGVVTEKKCTFTVNKKGTAFAVCGDENETKTAGFIPAVRMTNPDHIRIVSCMLNGREVNYSWDGELLRIDRDEVMPGKNTVTLETKDGAGNVSSMEPWEFYVRAGDTDSKESKLPQKTGSRRIRWFREVLDILRHILKLVLSAGL